MAGKLPAIRAVQRTVSGFDGNSHSSTIPQYTAMYPESIADLRNHIYINTSQSQKW